jgi:chromosome segregation ATPase
MTDEPSGRAGLHSLRRLLLLPVSAPQRVAGNIETIASVLIALQRDAQERLASLDKRVGALSVTLVRLDRRVAQLQELEQAVTEQTDAIRDDLNTRLLAVEEQIRDMQSPIDQMSRDLGTVVNLLPDPSDGPLARLKDTFTSS